MKTTQKRISKPRRGTKHGAAKELFYNTFQGSTYKDWQKVLQRYLDIIQRCYNPKRRRYEDYGGRGIKVCNEWLEDSRLFVKHIISLGYTPNTKLTLDRIDNNGDYSPANTRLRDYFLQNHNRRPKKTNKSGYEGVSFYKRLGKFQSNICIRGKQVYLGVFESAAEAVFHRNKYIQDNCLEDLYEVQVIKLTV